MDMKWTFVFLLFQLSGWAQQAPNFQFTTDEGEQLSLQDYDGQVLYISFWATWCKPCLNNFDKYRETRDKLEAMGVTLLNVSIDKNIEAWERALGTNENLNGVNVHADDIDSIQKVYNLYSIPAYEIINKSGHFVYLSQDGSRDIFTEFKNWIDQ